MSKKRKREVTDFDRDIVPLWDSLADENEDHRLDAARDLVSRVFDPKHVTQERLRNTLIRLFRGMCSSRISARL